MSQEDNLRRIIEVIREENDGHHIDFVVPGYAATKVIAYQGIRQDLIFCKKYVKRLFIENDPLVSSSLLYSFLVLYARCFTDSSSCKLEAADFSEDYNHLLNIHKEIMDMRHNFVAHRGETEHETGLAFLKLNIQDYSRRVVVKQIKRVFPVREQLVQYSELLDFLTKVAENKFKKAGEKVWKHMLQEYTAEDMALMKIAGPKAE